jgi:hypothetical protein
MARKLGNYRVAQWLDTVRICPVFVIERYVDGRWHPCVYRGKPLIFDLEYDACGMMLLLDSPRS